MKKISLFGILVLFNVSVFGQKIGTYELASVPSVDIDQYLPIGSAATGTPENLQGLFWMDGNPLADKIVSLAQVEFTDVTNEAGELVGHTMKFPVYDQGVWTWDDTEKGHFLYSLVHKFQLTYEGHFNADYTYGQISPIIRPLPHHSPVEIPSSLLVDFMMTKIAPDEFSRDSILLGKKYNYRFRRIVDGSGHRLPAYDDFINRVETQGPKNSLIPVCTLDNGATFPTACAQRLMRR